MTDEEFDRAWRATVKALCEAKVDVITVAEIGMHLIMTATITANNGDQQGSAYDLEKGLLPDLLGKIEKLKKNEFQITSVLPESYMTNLDKFDTTGKKPN